MCCSLICIYWAPETQLLGVLLKVCFLTDMEGILSSGKPAAKALLR